MIFSISYRLLQSRSFWVKGEVMRASFLSSIGKSNYLNKQSTASIYFDLIRALAAFAVLLHHIRPSFFVNYLDVSSKNPLIQIFYLISSKGYQSVMIFFVLSGFFISSSVVSSVAKSKWSWSIYMNQRITRLGVVLLPALLLTFMWNELSLLIFQDQALIGEMNGPAFWMNLFFLQGIGPFPSIMFGENDALWSLSIEFWFYILFPCMLLAFCSKSATGKIAYGVAAIALGLFLGKQVMPLFAIWLLGTVVLLIPDFKAPRKLWYRLVLLSVPLTAFAGAFLLSGRSKGFLINFIVGLTFASLLYVIRVLFNQRTYQSQSALRSLVLRTAGFSYTLYLTHFPINNLLVSYLNGNKLQPSAASFIIFTAIVLATILYAWIISMLTEDRTAEVRGFTSRMLRMLPFNRNSSKSSSSGKIAS
jgi:peptidoglycan/LPS O-acetylase OafA/YrhL